MFTKILVAIALMLAIATASMESSDLFLLTSMWGGTVDSGVTLADIDGNDIIDINSNNVAGE